MGIVQRAYRVIQEAERQVRALLEQAAAASDYDAVVPLAEIAKSLAHLRPPESTIEETTPKVSPPVSRKRKGTGAYPRFTCSGEELVKIGWSKSAKSEYEHKAPRVVALRLADKLEAFRKNGEIFRMDRVLPLKLDSNASDLPDYQVYLCLAWFRDLGWVSKQGRNGYSVTTRESLPQIINQGWQKLAKQRHSGKE